ncbi:MAG TPA: hypothetical protein VGW10_16130 [Solirubrobacteraceae bacterium]|nr:hypothetical protein [Solirubrobacteraceae bacterium]
MPSRWAAALVAALAVSLVLVGRDTHGADTPARPRHARLIENVPTRCDVGGRPGYFVPGDRRLALLGCARLGVSGKRVELSGSVSRIGRRLHLCINPAYSGRGRRGFYIPALCKLHPPPSRFAVRDAGQPRQGVRGYRFVVWGTAGAATADVVARFEEGKARAAVFTVGPRLARTFGHRPFALFVVELPLEAACGPVVLRTDAPDAPQRIPPRPEVCARG